HATGDAPVAEFLGDHGRVDDVAATASDLFRIRHPEQSDLGGLAMQLARQLAVALPLVLVGQDVLLGEPGGHLPQCLAFRGVERAGHNSSSGMSTCLLRNHSPSALACGSKRACDATPCPSRPLTTKFIALRFGSR